jgi:hypothetical protein
MSLADDFRKTAIERGSREAAPIVSQIRAAAERGEFRIEVTKPLPEKWDAISAYLESEGFCVFITSGIDETSKVFVSRTCISWEGDEE